ncbi:hypothetical protein Thena_0626 [Thermodesulfobium narugense DSM 14796]|uniref:Lipid II flippase Amj n=1 Tax=Thermodesulfobium narugense DSM 14796 TaxID=747365 RepID=M1E6P1_9BACT|nr:DUF2837 family protein [Thermodesulfobium narugense]AEE14263.1 hypothetical protein Thena_0626 [Thermodesulfobium narugense DSM 14796]
MLFLIMFFDFSIHLSEATASALRLAGLRTGKITTSLSFYNIIALVSRMSNMFQAPLLGVLVDSAVLTGKIDALGNNFRAVIFCGALGDILAIILLPYSVAFFSRIILWFEETGSVPMALFKLLSFKNIKLVSKDFANVKFLKRFEDFDFKGIPKKFIFFNIVVVAVYTVGVMSSLFAGAHLAAYRVTATQLSGIVNGLATILMAFVVDPTAALITDDALHKRRTYNNVESMVYLLLFTRILGSLVLSQIIFLPATWYIMSVTLFLHR